MEIVYVDFIVRPFLEVVVLTDDIVINAVTTRNFLQTNLLLDSVLHNYSHTMQSDLNKER